MVFVIVGVVVAVTGLIAAGTLWVLPLEWWGANKDAIQTFVLPFGAAGAVVALAFAGWRSWAQFQQVQTDRLRQVTDSFAKAVELLGHEDRSVRLGAIYALERIARQNRDEHWPIMETLTAYVRQWSERTQQEPHEGWGEAGRVEVWDRAPSDIAAVFTVLGRRRIDHELDGRSASRRPNLNGAYLVNVIPDPPPSRQFERVVLAGAKLADTDLGGANLKSATLFCANLQEASLDRADLRGAVLDMANLKEAFLRGADLSTAKGLTQEQLNSAKGDKDTKIPQGLCRPKHWK